MGSPKFRVALLLAMALATAPHYSLAQTGGPASRPSDDVIYQPPPHSQGNTRVEGSAQMRGDANALPSLFILAPDHIGLTTDEQPAVFWYLSKPTNAPLVLTIMPDDAKAKEPLLEVKLDATKSGIQSLDLAKCNVKLEPGVDYQLSLALKPVSNQGANDVFCSAEIMRVAPPHSLLAQMLATSDPLEKAKLLAKNGMFYDALTIISREIDSDATTSKPWHERRAGLLDQVGLADVASFDRSPPPTVHSALQP